MHAMRIAAERWDLDPTEAEEIVVQSVALIGRRLGEPFESIASLLRLSPVAVALQCSVGSARADMDPLFDEGVWTYVAAARHYRWMVHFLRLGPEEAEVTAFPPRAEDQILGPATPPGMLDA